MPLKFLNDEIPAFGTYFSEFEDKLSFTDVFFTFHINNLQTKSEVLKWYIEMNSGGTIHTDEEINRVKQLLEKEKWKRKIMNTATKSKIDKIESLIEECKECKIDCKTTECSECPFDHEIGSENLMQIIKGELCFTNNP